MEDKVIAVCMQILILEEKQTEAVVWRCSVKKVFLEWRNIFFNKVTGLQLY